MSEVIDEIERSAMKGDKTLRKEADLDVRNRQENTSAIDPDIHDSYELKKAGYAVQNAQDLPQTMTQEGASIVAGKDMSDGHQVATATRHSTNELQTDGNQRLRESEYGPEGVDEKGMEGLTMLMASAQGEGILSMDVADSVIGETHATREQRVEAWNSAATTRQEQSRQQVDGLPADLQQLPADRNYLAAVTLIELALGNDPSKMTADELVQRGLEWADAAKSSDMHMIRMATGLDEEASSALLYLLDVDERLPLTGADVGRHTMNMLMSPSTYLFGGGVAAKGAALTVGKQAVRSALAGAAMGGGYGGLYDAAMQKIEITGGQAKGYDALRGMIATGVGTTFGGVLGGATPYAMEVAGRGYKYTSGYMKELSGAVIENWKTAPPNTPWNMHPNQRGSVGFPATPGMDWVPELASRFWKLPEGNVKAARIKQIVKETQKEGLLGSKDEAFKGLDRLLEGRTTIPKAELVDYMQEQTFTPKRVVAKTSDGPDLAKEEILFIEAKAADTWEDNWEDYTSTYTLFEEAPADIQRQFHEDYAFEFDTQWSDYNMAQLESTAYSGVTMKGRRSDYIEQLVILPTSPAYRKNFGDEFFQDAHWSDNMGRLDAGPLEDNVIGFGRLTDRVLDSGNDTRVIEELQSDWNTMGSKDYVDMPTAADRWVHRLPDGSYKTRDMTSEQATRLNNYGQYPSSPDVAESPYRDAWPIMVFEDMIDEAIGDGKKYMALPTEESVALTEGFANHSDSRIEGTLRQYRKKILPKLTRYLKKYGIEPELDYVEVPRSANQLHQDIGDATNRAAAEVIDNVHPRLTRNSDHAEVLNDIMMNPEYYNLDATGDEVAYILGNSSINMTEADLTKQKVPVMRFEITDKLKEKIKSSKFMPAVGAAPLGAMQDDRE